MHGTVAVIPVVGSKLWLISCCAGYCSVGSMVVGYKLWLNIILCRVLLGGLEL